MNTVCFTGRRPKDLCGYEASKYTHFKQQLLTMLESLYSEGVRRFISGGAQGFDQLAFQTVAQLKRIHPDIENVIYVPFRGQERRWAQYGLFSINEYYKMLNAADEVVYLEDTLDDYSAIARALMDRNHHMVNDSDMVIALYPHDDWERVKGGTAECMRYAKSVNKPIRQIKYTIENGMLTF